MADAELYHALCDYYCRERLYNSVRLSAAEAMKNSNNGDVTVFRFWSTCGLALEGGWSEALQEVEVWPRDFQLQLVSLLVKLYCLQCSGAVEQTRPAELENELKETRRRASAVALGWAGLFLLQCGQAGRARQYLDRALRAPDCHVSVWVTRAWAAMGAGEAPGDVQRYLSEAAARDDRHPSLLLCLARAAQFNGQWEASGVHLDSLLAAQPSFVPPLLEKMKLSLALHDSEQCREMSVRSLSLVPQCVEALLHSLVLDMAELGAGECVGERLEQFRQAVYRLEPRNGHYLLRCVRVLSRLCGGDAGVISVCLSMCRQAAKLATVGEAASVELGYLNLMAGRYEQAQQQFSAVSREHETSLEPLVGALWCDLLARRSDAAASSLQFVQETQQTLGSTSAELLLLSAMVERQHGCNPDSIASLLAECIDVHFRGLRSLTLGIDYLIALNPHFLMLVADECMLHAPEEPVAPGSVVPRCVKLAESVLEPLVRVCPGLIRGELLMAECRHLAGDWRTARTLLTRLAERQRVGSEHACLLLAHVLLSAGHCHEAASWLHQALALSFAVKQLLRYHWLLARVQRSEGALSQAADSLLEALRLAGLSQLLSDQPSRDMHPPEGVSSGRQWQLVCELVQVYCCMQQVSQARRLLDRARLLLPADADKATLSEAEVLLAECRVLDAIRLLSSVTVQHSHFVASRRLMANIYRDHLKDARKFAACYREIVDAEPSPASYILLGDAYMAIVEPERAIDVYQTAVKRNPRNHELAVKMGRALVQTHQYDRAVNYYREAIRAGGDDQLRYDMARLLIRMRQYDRAERAIEHALQHVQSGVETADVPLQQLRTHCQLLQLLAQVHELVSGQERALSSLQQACDVEQRVFRRAQLQLSQREVAEARRSAVSTCCRLARLQRQWLHLSDAELTLRKAIELAADDDDGDDRDGDEQPQVLLAQLFLQSGRMDECRQTCVTFLQRHPDNQHAATVMAEVSFRCGEFSTALRHYDQLLQRKPDNFLALVAAIDLLRRSGRSAEIVLYLNSSREACTTQSLALPAGLLLCYGLAAWYSGRRDEALRHLNEARGDAQWRLRVSRCMIDIYLHQVLDSRHDSADQQRDTCLHNVQTLLPLFSPQSAVRRLLVALVQVADVSRAGAERAMPQLEQLSAQLEGPERVSALWGLALAQLQLKQGSRALSVLSTAGESAWTPDCGDVLESCWLRLVELHVESGRPEAAVGLLERTLNFNQSCSEAHLKLAEIHERNGASALSIASYQQAWRLTGHSDPRVGYKLACAHLKSRRYVHAIQACHQVLKQNPDYPKIRKEILEKARALLKT